MAITDLYSRRNRQASPAPTFTQRLSAAVRSFLGQDRPTDSDKTPSRSVLRGRTIMSNPRLVSTQGFARNPSVLVQRKSLGVFREMLKDEMVKAALTFKKQCVVASGWTVESPDDQDEEWEVTAFVRDCFEKIDGSFAACLIEMLTALDYGFSVTEKVFTERDGKLALSALRTSAPDGIQFLTDQWGNLQGIEQSGNRYVNTLETPLGKYIVFSWDKEFGNFYGKADLEAAHRPWLIKAQAYNWLGILLERFGIPPLLIHYDHNAIPEPVQGMLQEAVQAWNAGMWALIPRGETADSVGFEIPEVAGQTSNVFIPSMKMFDEAISRALLMPGLIGMTPDTEAGSKARSEVHFDVFVLVVEYLRNQLADTVIQDKVVKLLVDLNFPAVKKYPVFKFLPLTDEIKETLMTTWAALVAGRVVQTTPADEDHIRESMKFPLREVAEKSAEDLDPASSPYGPGLQPSDPDNPANQMPEPDPNAPGNGKPPGKGGSNSPAKGGKPPASKGKPPAKPGAKVASKSAPEPAKPHSSSAVGDVTAYDRPLTQYERKVDFQQINRDLDELLDAYLERMKGDMRAIEEALVSDMRKNWQPTLDFAQSVSVLPKTDPLHTDFQAFFKDGFNRGRASLVREIPKEKKRGRYAEQSLPDVNLDDALTYLRSKSLFVSGVTDQKVLSEVRQALLQAVSNGETLDEVIDRLKEIFRPYVESRMGANGELLEPARLETIVRTNLTDVYNQGRMVQGADAEEFLEGWQYSAIIDQRTTDICKHLDGKVFLAGDKRAMSLRPPRHFNCRSVMVPIVVGEVIDPDHVITDADANKAKDLSGSTF